MVPVIMTESQIHLFFANLTKSGLKSIIFGLGQQGLVAKNQVVNEQLYSLSSLGREQCEALFPSLNQQAMDMSLLIFKQAPVSDQGFHYLRKRCLQVKAILLIRGVYLFPTGIPYSLKNEIKKLYKNAIIVLKVNSIESGFDWQAINEALQLWDMTSVYSGISKELTQLLTDFKSDKGWTYALKKHLSKLLERLIEALAVDAGLDRASLPDESRPLCILSRLQKIHTL